MDATTRDMKSSDVLHVWYGAATCGRKRWGVSPIAMSRKSNVMLKKTQTRRPAPTVIFFHVPIPSFSRHQSSQGANPGVRALPPAAAQSNAESRANYFSTGAGQAAAQARAASRFPRDSQTTPTSSTETFAGTSANLAASGAARQPGDDARGAGALSPTDSATAVDGVQDASIVTPAVAADDENRGFNLADMFSRWGTSGVSPPPSTHDEGKSLRGGIQRPARTNLSGADERQDRTAAASSTALVGPSAAPEVGEEGDSSGTAGSADIFEVENRARSYLQNKVEAAGAARAVAPPTSLVPSRTGSVGTEKETGSTPTLSNEKKAASADDERSGNPLVVGPGSRCDDRRSLFVKTKATREKYAIISSCGMPDNDAHPSEYVAVVPGVRR